jgi:hypothetical protein
MRYGFNLQKTITFLVRVYKHEKVGAAAHIGLQKVVENMTEEFYLL